MKLGKLFSLCCLYADKTTNVLSSLKLKSIIYRYCRVVPHVGDDLGTPDTVLDRVRPKWHLEHAAKRG
jgi:hypothetical protein